jgi:hypothetical protein
VVCLVVTSWPTLNRCPVMRTPYRRAKEQGHDTRSAPVRVPAPFFGEDIPPVLDRRVGVFPGEMLGGLGIPGDLSGSFTAAPGRTPTTSPLAAFLNNPASGTPLEVTSGQMGPRQKEAPRDKLGAQGGIMRNVSQQSNTGRVPRGLGLPADSDEAGRLFQGEAGHLFRFHSGQCSDLKPAPSSVPGSWRWWIGIGRSSIGR